MQYQKLEELRVTSFDRRLSYAERKDALEKTLDLSILWNLQASISQKSTGVGGASTVIDSTLRTLERLGDLEGTAGNNTYVFSYLDDEDS